MSDETFIEHLTYLSQLGALDVALLYNTLSPWPRCEDTALNPISLIVFTVAQLIERLAPNSQPEEYPEVGALSQAVGLLLYQLSQVEMIAQVASLPAVIQGEMAQKIGEGAQQVGIQISEILGMNYGETGLIVYTEEKDGKTETAESGD